MSGSSREEFLGGCDVSEERGRMGRGVCISDIWECRSTYPTTATTATTTTRTTKLGTTTIMDFLCTWAFGLVGVYGKGAGRCNGTANFELMAHPTGAFHEAASGQATDWHRR